MAAPSPIQRLPAGSVALSANIAAVRGLAAGSENFEGDLAAQLEIPRCVDDAHAARTDRLLHLVSAGQRPLALVGPCLGEEQAAVVAPAQVALDARRAFPIEPAVEISEQLVLGDAGHRSPSAEVFGYSINDGRFKVIEPAPAWQAFVDAAHAAHPGIALEPEVFAAHVEARRRGEPLQALHAGDLFLACACARGLAPAVSVFERDHLSRVRGFVARVDSGTAFADEVTQRLRELFLMGGLTGYSGRGALASWVRITAVRTALRLKREQPRADDLPQALRSPVDPELDYLKLRYRGAYQQALKALLMKLHYLDGLSIDRIGAIYGMHRSTVARWRARVSRALLDSIRAQVCSALRLSDSEFDSVAFVVRSQLVLSLRSALQRPE